MQASERLLGIAISQIGEKESPIGSNSGKMVDEYLKSIGLSPGYAWCMAFVYWCHKKAGIESSLLKTGGVMRMWNERQKLCVKTPSPGDIFIMDYGRGTGHTGIVEFINGTNAHTIEGNTNDEGSREGYEVCRRVRPLSKIKGFLRAKGMSNEKEI